MKKSMKYSEIYAFTKSHTILTSSVLCFECFGSFKSGIQQLKSLIWGFW